MPAKERGYNRVIFTPEVIKQAIQVLRETLSDKSKLANQALTIRLSPIEQWHYDNEEEFFTDYRKGCKFAHFSQTYRTNKDEGTIEVWVHEDSSSRIVISMTSRIKVEKVSSIFESNVEKCRLPRQPKLESKIKTDWITETINKIEGRCPIAGRKLKLAIINLDSEEVEDWQNATMLIRDAWIELTQWLCQVKNIDSTDIEPDAVIDRLKKLGVNKTDERLFNLARASFNLYSKHHKRDISNDTATACVLSTIVSMQTVIREVF